MANAADDVVVVIEMEDLIYRRLAQHQIKHRKTPTSYAYIKQSKPEQEPSHDVARLTTPFESVNRTKRAGLQLAEISRGNVYACPCANHDVKYSPIPPPEDMEENLAHCHITGEVTHDSGAYLARKLQPLQVFSENWPKPPTQ